MCKVIAISSNKGGVAKTTSTLNLGIGLARKGKKVLLIDVDGQADLTKCLGVKDPEKLNYTLTDALQAIVNEENPDPEAGIMHHDEGVDFIPGKSTLAVLDKELGNIPGGDTVLKDYVDMLRGNYEYILIDSKPAMVTLSVNVMAAADLVLIPVVTEYLPITDIEATILSIRLVQRRINRKLKIEGILLTKVKSRTILAREAEEAVREAYEKNIKVFDAKIPLSTKVAEAPALGISIYRYDPHGKASEAYESLTREVLANE